MASVNQIVQVTVSVSRATPSRAAFGIPLILSKTPTWSSERIRSYRNLAAVGTDFAEWTDVYRFAEGLFSQTPRPAQVKVGKWAGNDASVKAALSAIEAVDRRWYLVLAPAAYDGTEATEAATIKAIAEWVQAATTRHAFLAEITGASVLAAGDTVASQLKAGNYSRTIPTYHGATPQASKLVFDKAFAAGQSVTLQVNGRTVTQAFVETSDMTLAFLAMKIQAPYTAQTLTGANGFTTSTYKTIVRELTGATIGLGDSAEVQTATGTYTHAVQDGQTRQQVVNALIALINAGDGDPDWIADSSAANTLRLTSRIAGAVANPLSATFAYTVGVALGDGAWAADSGAAASSGTKTTIEFPLYVVGVNPGAFDYYARPTDVTVADFMSGLAARINVLAGVTLVTHANGVITFPEGAYNTGVSSVEQQGGSTLSLTWGGGVTIDNPVYIATPVDVVGGTDNDREISILAKSPWIDPSISGVALTGVAPPSALHTVTTESSNPLAAALAGRVLAYDAGTVNWSNQANLTGIVADDLTDTQIGFLTAQRVNYYAPFTDDLSMTREGWTSSPDYYADQLIGLDALVTEIEDVSLRLFTSTPKIPKTDDGKRTIQTAFVKVCRAFKRSGFLTGDVDQAVDVDNATWNDRVLEGVTIDAEGAGALNGLRVQVNFSEAGA